ncbi:putative toxin-antitoxin system toxin component, PIN family [Synechocystis sp. FACHB-383]|nr:putative toxin-antitoxin system toxin component, PIN family [Synechocystis sp. FACHB-383]
MSRRYVFDTNVLVSAVLSAHSVPRQAFNLAFTTGTILMSYPIVNELNEVLSRPKFRRYLSAEKRDIFIWSLFRKARFIDVIKEKIDICRDAKDNQFLSLFCQSG